LSHKIEKRIQSKKVKKSIAQQTIQLETKQKKHGFEPVELLRFYMITIKAIDNLKRE
jgi:hypothetical protein